jgi:hypothetical protein
LFHGDGTKRGEGWVVFAFPGLVGAEGALLSDLSLIVRQEAEIICKNMWGVSRTVRVALRDDSESASLVALC